MGIHFRCPECRQPINVRSEFAGRTGKCPHCRKTVVVPRTEDGEPQSYALAEANPLTSPQLARTATAPPIADASAPAASEPAEPLPGKTPVDRGRLLALVMQGFSGGIAPVRTGLAYRIATTIVAGCVVLLPAIYVALVALAGWGVWWHATENTEIANMGRGRGRVFAVLLYLAPIITGVICVLFMLKPLLARPHRDKSRVTATRAGQPILFAFVERLCDLVGAPHPDAIELDFNINASASYSGGTLSMLRSRLVLTIGMPLIVGLSLQQMAGVLAHEFGHFTQGAGMRVSWVVRSINLWFARVVYERDEWDVWLVAASQETDMRIAWVLWVARLGVWFSRRVLWCLMMVSHALTCWLLRQMEFDADRYEARVAGSETFRSTCIRLHEIGAAFTSFWKAQVVHRVPSNAANPMRELERYLEALQESDQNLIRRRIEKSTTGWLDTHPADQERIESARRENSAGVFHSDLPAEALIPNYDQLCAALMRV